MAFEKVREEIREDLKSKGIIGSSPSARPRGWSKKCVVCGKDLPKHLKETCSGSCYLENKEK